MRDELLDHRKAYENQLSKLYEDYKTKNLMTEQRYNELVERYREDYGNFVKGKVEQLKNYYGEFGGMTDQVKKAILKALNFQSGVPNSFTTNEYGSDRVQNAYFAGNTQATNNYLGYGFEDNEGGLRWNPESNQVELQYSM